MENLDFDSLYYFDSILTLVLDKHAPLKTVTVTPLNKNLWFTSNLLTESRKRRQLEHTWRNSRYEVDWLLYKNQSHLYNSLVRKAQSNCFSSLIKNCSDSKSLAFNQPSLSSLQLIFIKSSIHSFCYSV